MSMFNGLFRKQDAKGNVVNETKGLVFKCGEPTIIPIKIYNDDDYVGSITKRNDGFVFESYVCMTLNYNTCARIAEKLKELNDGSNT